MESVSGRGIIRRKDYALKMSIISEYLWLAPLLYLFSFHPFEKILAVNVLPQKEKYLPDYNIYRNVTHVGQDLRKIASLHPDFVRIEWRHQSREKRPQLVAHIANFSTHSVDESFLTQKQGTPSKVPILFSYGEHAREFFPVESFFHLLTNLTGGLNAELGSYEETFARSVLTHFDIYAIVMANPDGRIYLESSQNFCWRGTSTGVDLNRNFDWQFAEPGSSSNFEDEEYRGPIPFSEPESRVYIHLSSLVHFDAFVSFHSGVRHIYMPFADTASKALRRVPHNNRAMEILIARISTATKYSFKFGKAYDLSMYTADGTIFDYMAGVKQIPFSLAVEMWENEHHTGTSCFDEFNPASQHLQAEVEALHPLYVELFSYLEVWKRQQTTSMVGATSDLNKVAFLTLNCMLVPSVAVLCAVLTVLCRCNAWSPGRCIVSFKRLFSPWNVTSFFK